MDDPRALHLEYIGNFAHRRLNGECSAERVLQRAPSLMPTNFGLYDKLISCGTSSARTFIGLRPSMQTVAIACLEKSRA
jgi:hypothetical protein